MKPVFPKGRAIAFSLAMLAWASVALQCCLSVQLALHNGKSIGDGLEIFFSYFTVLTNLLICVSLTVSLLGTSSALGKWFSRPATVAGIATSIARRSQLSLPVAQHMEPTRRTAASRRVVALRSTYPLCALLVVHLLQSRAAVDTSPVLEHLSNGVLGLRVISWKHSRQLSVSLYRCRELGLQSDDAQLVRPPARVHRLRRCIRRAGPGAPTHTY